MQAPENGEESAERFRQVDRQINRLKVLQSWQGEAVVQVKATEAHYQPWDMKGESGFFWPRFRVSSVF